MEINEKTVYEAFIKVQKNKIRNMHTVNYAGIGITRKTKVDDYHFKYNYHFFPGFYVMPELNQTKRVRRVLDKLVKQGKLEHEQKYSGGTHYYSLPLKECLKIAKQVIKELEKEDLQIDIHEPQIKRYENHKTAIEVTGTVSYYTYAKNKKEAAKKFKDGNCFKRTEDITVSFSEFDNKNIKEIEKHKP